MNKSILMGRLTRDPDVRSSQGEKSVTVAKFTLAVPRKFKNNGQEESDFINCVAFGKVAEFCSNYLHKGIKVILSGRIQTGSYTNKEGQKVYTTDVVAEEVEFAESKGAQQSGQNAGDGFMNIPDDINEELPFN